MLFQKQKNVCSIRTIYDIMRHTNNELWKETEKRYELIRCTERTTAAGCDGNRRTASDPGRCRVRKTRVLTHRTAYLIEECGVNPYNIMAITFTNKAAGEMRERIDQMVGYGSESIWVCTFHSTCVRILRRYIDRLGFGTNFTIYDSDDQKTLMKDICKRLEIDTKMYKEKMFLSAISSAKDELIDPIEYETRAAGDYVKRKQAQVYREYQQALKQNNALDLMI